MGNLVKLMAIFALLLTMEVSALCQTQPSPSTDPQGDKRQQEPAKESSNEEKEAVEPTKELPKERVRLTIAPIRFDKLRLPRQIKVLTS